MDKILSGCRNEFNAGYIVKIAGYAKEIGADRIQLNTVVRPPAEDYAMAAGSRHALAVMEHPKSLAPEARILGT